MSETGHRFVYTLQPGEYWQRMHDGRMLVKSPFRGYLVVGEGGVIEELDVHAYDKIVGRGLPFGYHRPERNS